MKRHLPSAAILFALLLVLCFQAFAADAEPDGEGIPFYRTQEPTADTSLVVPAAFRHTAYDRDGAPAVTVDGRSLAPLAATALVDGTVYVTAAPILHALWPDVAVALDGGRLTARAEGLSLVAVEGAGYFSVNDRYCYAPQLVRLQDGAIYLPAEPLAAALGCSGTADPDTGDVVLWRVRDPISAGTYDGDDLYWLSRAIYAESGNQPMAGRVAVGTVILNRVADPRFPDTIEGVIFAPGQFSPVSNGTIYREPDAESVIAAQLCLDGAREAGASLYFNVNSLNSWANQARSYVCTIGGHSFFS